MSKLNQVTIKGTETTVRQVDIDVSAGDLVYTLKKHIFKKYGLHVDAMLDGKGRIIVEIEGYGGSHAWYETQVLVEDPSEELIELLQLFKKLYKYVEK